MNLWVLTLGLKNAFLFEKNIEFYEKKRFAMIGRIKIYQNSIKKGFTTLHSKP